MCDSKRAPAFIEVLAEQAEEGRQVLTFDKKLQRLLRQAER